MQLIDSHCHLDFKQFDHDRNEILANCRRLGLTRIIIPGVMATTWAHLLDICQQSDMLYPALGLHPMFMPYHQANDVSKLADYIEQHQPIAIGEIGLDFYLPDHDKASQIDIFEQQLVLAKKAALPVILHVRKAHEQTLALLKKHAIKGGIVHAFSGSKQQAMQYSNLGFLLGVGGTISYDKATRLRKLFSELALDTLALETDAPDMPLQGLSKTRNTPENIPRILSHLAQLRSEPIDQIAQTTTQNVHDLLFQ